MKSVKQIALCLLIVLAAVGGWYGYKNRAEAPQEPSQGAASGAGTSRSGAGKATLVVVEPAGEETINNRLTAIGSARALQTVSITPYSSGYLNKLLVKAGDAVKTGDPIAELDNDSEIIAVNKAKVALQDAENALQRIARLRATNTATAVQEIEAQLALSNTKLALQDAQLALDRRTVRAPIPGVIGILPVNAGNYVTAETAIARIDDRSKVLIDIWVPERFAPQIKVGQPVQAESTAFAGVQYDGRISAVDNTLDEASRTLHIRAEVENEQDRLRAGMSFSVTILFPGDHYPSVNPLAIQWGADGSYVWRVEEGVAKKVAARIVQRNSTNILVDGAINAGDMIVTQGVQTVRDNAPVRLLDEKGTALADPSQDRNAG